MFNNTVLITVMLVTVFSTKHRCFSYRSGETLYAEGAFTEEKAVFIIIIHRKAVQWESRGKSLLYYKSLVLVH